MHKFNKKCLFINIRLKLKKNTVKIKVFSKFPKNDNINNKGYIFLNAKIL